MFVLYSPHQGWRSRRANIQGPARFLRRLRNLSHCKCSKKQRSRKMFQTLSKTRVVTKDGAMARICSCPFVQCARVPPCTRSRSRHSMDFLSVAAPAQNRAWSPADQKLAELPCWWCLTVGTRSSPRGAPSARRSCSGRRKKPALTHWSQLPHSPSNFDRNSCYWGIRGSQEFRPEQYSALRF